MLPSVPMPASGDPRATYRDLLALDEDVRAEIIDGRVTMLPSILPRHSRVQGGLARSIGGPFDQDDGAGGPGGWWIFSEVDVQLSVHDVVRPDVAGWHRDRLPKPGGVRPITVTPDWICEVISPSNGAHDRVTKRALYARHGVGHYWIVDPELRILEALELAGDRWIELGAWDDTATAVRIAPFDAIGLDVGRLFLPRDADG